MDNYIFCDMLFRIAEQGWYLISKYFGVPHENLHPFVYRRPFSFEFIERMSCFVPRGNITMNSYCSQVIQIVLQLSHIIFGIDSRNTTCHMPQTMQNDTYMLQFYPALSEDPASQILFSPTVLPEITYGQTFHIRYSYKLYNV